MNWFESILYGLISGITEFLPVPARAHQQIFTHLIGSGSAAPLCDLLVHIALLLALYTSARPLFASMRADRHMLRSSRHMQGRIVTRLVKTAAPPMLVLLLFYPALGHIGDSLPALSVLLVLNGLILFIPNFMLQGNKDARSMSVLDSLLIGFFGGLSVFSGISRVGAATSVAVARGADKQHAFHWILLLSFPALLVLIGFDLISIISNGLSSNFLYCILAGAGAYIGGYFGVKLMRTTLCRLSYSGFAYYCWGIAMFTFILYLTV